MNCHSRRINWLIFRVMLLYPHFSLSDTNPRTTLANHGNLIVSLLNESLIYSSANHSGLVTFKPH